MSEERWQVYTNKTTIPTESSPYDRTYTLNEHEITQGKIIFDYYKISAMCEVNDPWLDHAGKKILFGGKRGHKDLVIDIEEAIKTLQKKLAYLRECEQ